MTNNATVTLNENVKALTFTIIFEGSALNRDEKIGGNIPSIKKLTRCANGRKSKTFSFISRESMRHHLFVTLNAVYPEIWSQAPTTATNDVVQFDLTKANILSHAELDAFGYMFTQSKNAAITRKGTVGLQKAIALESWEGDMQFNANHDVAARCGSYPNPVNKEEHLSFYKASFTIDIEKLGKDEWKIQSHEALNGSVNLYMTDKGQEFIIPNTEKDDVEGEVYIISKERVTIDGNRMIVPDKLMKKDEKKKQLSFDIKIPKTEKQAANKEGGKGKSKKQSFAIPESDYSEENGSYSFSITSTEYDPVKKELKISRVMSFGVPYHEERGGKYMLNADKENYLEIIEPGPVARFVLDPAEKIKRIRTIIETIKNGLYFHTSGENTGIIPKFIVGAALKLPVPLFHSYVDLGGFNNAISENAYIINDSNEHKSIFCQNHMGADSFNVNGAEVIWNTFLQQLGLCEANNEQTNSQD